MAGFRDFQTGEVLTAANVNDFLMQQSVMKFADATARDTALGTAVGGSNALREGMVAYLDDTDDLQVYNGTAWSGVGYRYAGTRYYTSSGSFAKADPLGTGDIGLRAIRVRCVGGGGGAGGCDYVNIGDAAAGGSGGGGGYAESFITDIAGLASSVTVTRGLGGAGGSGAVGSGQGGAGTAGGDSSFGTQVIAKGGTGGLRGPDADRVVPNAGSAESAAGTGDITFRGQGSDFGFIGGGLTRCVAASPAGGRSLLGPGAPGLSTTTDNSATNGNSATVYGGGGSGGVATATTTAQDGPDGGGGANGIVIVDCYV